MSFFGVLQVLSILISQQVYPDFVTILLVFLLFSFLIELKWGDGTVFLVRVLSGLAIA